MFPSCQPRLRKRLLLGLMALLTAGCLAQVPPYSSERPGGAGSDPLEQPRDLTGRSVKTPRVRVVHGTDLPGSSGWLMRNDPWLAYQRGRDLAVREFSLADGAFGDSGRLSGKVLDDQATLLGSRDHVNSCIACHNVPWRDLGAGITIQKNAGSGRNTPHVFGGGQVEMVGQEIRRQLMQQADRNGDGMISLEEASAAGPATVESTRGHALDFGFFDDRDGNGRPDLNPVVFCWYCDGEGHRIPWARNLKGAGVAGYGLEVQVFGFGQRDRIGHGGLGSTLRSVTANAWDIHSGLQVHDPTLNVEPRRDGLARVSLPGAQQFCTGFTRDAGTVCTPYGVSLDDPDRDGVVEEVSEGDLDLIEFFQLNHPAPTEMGGAAFERGRPLFTQSGCTDCHVPDWNVPHDRRFFDLSVRPQGEELVGYLRRVQVGQPLVVRGIYSDFRQHDLGEAFYETQYDGSQTRRFKTAPLWGVGSTAPYGHDGGSLSLDQVIRRHGGEAAAAAAAYRQLDDGQRADLLAFLGGLVLYQTERLPCDLDGDGRVADHFVVAGEDTGRETFNPEWLFVHPAQIEGPVTAPDGYEIVSHAVTNLTEAYGLNLLGLRDVDHDGFPDWLQGRAAGRLLPFKPVGQR